MPQVNSLESLLMRNDDDDDSSISSRDSKNPDPLKQGASVSTVADKVQASQSLIGIGATSSANNTSLPSTSNHAQAPRASCMPAAPTSYPNPTSDYPHKKYRAKSSVCRTPKQSTSNPMPPNYTPPTPSMNMSKADISKRLKNMYSPAHKPKAAVPQSTAPANHQHHQRQPVTKPWEAAPKPYPTPASSITAQSRIKITPNKQIPLAKRQPQRSNGSFASASERILKYSPGTNQPQSKKAITSPTAYISPKTTVESNNRSRIQQTYKSRPMHPKERLYKITGVLMRYLKGKDPAMHQKCVLVVNDCVARNRRQERGYESVTNSVGERLRKLVGPEYWKRAEVYSERMLHEQERRQLSQKRSNNCDRDSHTFHASPSISSSPNHVKQGEIQQRRNATKPKLNREPQMSNASAAEQTAKRETHNGKKQGQKLTPPVRQNTVTQPVGPGHLITVKNKSPVKKRQRSSSTTTAKTRKKQKPVQSNNEKPLVSPKEIIDTKSKTKSKLLASATVLTSAPTPTPTPTPSTVPTFAPSTKLDRPKSLTRECNYFMEMVDHATDCDGAMINSLMQVAKPNLKLEEEQCSLLYSTTPSLLGTKLKALAGINHDKGWGERNVVTTRTAWARIRLPEQHEHKTAHQQTVSTKRLFPEFGPDEPPLTTSPSNSCNNNSMPSKSTWISEVKAEEDVALALLSTATQIYLKSVLEKALHCARQRQKLDPIRLWHDQQQQQVTMCTLLHRNSPPPPPLPLSLRLGCDVTRQLARSMGNATLICKRMEEALERRRCYPSLSLSSLAMIQREAMSSSSMSSLALKAKLKRGVEDAEYYAIQSYEFYYGGKREDGSSIFMDPTSFGRVPKKVKIEAIDLKMSMHLSGATIAI